MTLSRGCKGDLELTKGIKRIRLESPGDALFIAPISWRTRVFRVSNFGSDFGVDLAKDKETWMDVLIH